MTASPNINYNTGYYPYNSYQPQWQTQPQNYASSAQYSQPATVPQAAPGALSHIPYQTDVLSLSTKPDNNQVLNTQQEQIEKTPEIEHPETSLQNSSLQMQDANIQTIQENNLAAQNKTQENLNTLESSNENPVPSLNIGMVDAPNNASLTPVIDDINSRAGDFERSNPLEIRKNETSPVPISLGKKPINAGKLSAGLMFGSLGIISLMLIPKGISKIIKLIKHK